MLVLSRKINEEIIIDGCIRVRIIETKGNRIRVGIDAPANISVHRAELPCATMELSPDENAMVLSKCYA